MDAFKTWIGSNQNPLLICSISLVIFLVLYTCQLIEWIAVYAAKIAKLCFGYNTRNRTEDIPTVVRFRNNKVHGQESVEIVSPPPPATTSVPTSSPEACGNNSCFCAEETYSIKNISGSCLPK